MSPTVPIALFCWPLVVLVLFAVLKPRQAALAGFLGGWLFLPMAGYEFAGLPGYGKMEAASYGALVGMLLFDSARLGRLRFSWIDIPIVVWCLVPMASSLTNGLGAYDGASAVWGQSVTWGAPYLIGRMYFSDLEGLRTLAIGVVVGGLLYVPLCLLEVRVSPLLHVWLYGFHQHSWQQTYRFDGWRPTVFMQHGLAVGMWMTSASLVALWLWWTGAVRRVWSFPMGWVVVAIVVTTVLCKSAGAIALLAVGAIALAIAKVFRTNTVFAVLALVPVLYMGLRAPGIWDGSHLLEAVESIVPSKQGSLRYRIDAESTLAEHALWRPTFGWGGHGRNRPSRMGDDVRDWATDGLWIITLGQRGVIGLVAMSAIILLPTLLLLVRLPSAFWLHPKTAPVAALGLVLALFMVDCLFNAMVNPIFVLATGGIGGWLVTGSAMYPRASAASKRRRSERCDYGGMVMVVADRIEDPA